ncbi:XkdX family protein [Loigolactobacillus backii]|nr:XkdX family protein [Loigolactobacillus backii]
MGDLVKQYYQLGLYTTDNLKVFVQAAYITAADFKSLTGNDYSVTPS